MPLRDLLPNASEDFLAANGEPVTAGPPPLVKAPVPNKYHAQRTSGYPSKRHALYAGQLEWRLKAGEIKGWIEEVPFRLPGGTKHRVDFGVIGLDDMVEWVEVKGKDLDMGRIKRRQVEELYSIVIKVV